MRGAPRVDVVMKISDSLVREERCDLSQRKLQFVRPIISRQVQEFSNLAKNHVPGKYSTDAVVWSLYDLRKTRVLTPKSKREPLNYTTLHLQKL
jgi:hypothetical protein